MHSLDWSGCAKSFVFFLVVVEQRLHFYEVELLPLLSDKNRELCRLWLVVPFTSVIVSFSMSDFVVVVVQSQ